MLRNKYWETDFYLSSSEIHLKSEIQLQIQTTDKQTATAVTFVILELLLARKAFNGSINQEGNTEQTETYYSTLIQLFSLKPVQLRHKTYKPT